MEFAMNLQQRVNQQRNKEGRSLKIFMGSSLMGSLACHALALNVSLVDLWSPQSIPETIDEIEVQVLEVPVPEELIPEDPIPEALIPENPLRRQPS